MTGGNQLMMSGEHPQSLANGPRRCRHQASIASGPGARPRSPRPLFDRLPAEGGWSAVLRLPATRPEEEWTFELLRRDVIAHPGHFYDMTGEAYLVLSLIPEVDRFAWALGRLADLVAG